MTLTVISLNDARFHLPYYRNMKAGVFLTHVVAPALGCDVQPGSGDVLENFVHEGKLVFTGANADKYIGELLDDGATLYHTRLARSVAPLAGNGDLRRPTAYQLVLEPSVHASYAASSDGK